MRKRVGGKIIGLAFSNLRLSQKGTNLETGAVKSTASRGPGGKKRHKGWAFLLIKPEGTAGNWIGCTGLFLIGSTQILEVKPNGSHITTC